MRSDVTLLDGEVKQFGYRFTPDVVQATVLSGLLGVYLLLKDGKPVYVGRSDTCIKRRLERHPWLGVATHFVWQLCRTPYQAFVLEASWYHQLDGCAGVLNLVHPARPAFDTRHCPFCGVDESNALRRVLPHVGYTNTPVVG